MYRLNNLFNSGILDVKVSDRVSGFSTIYAKFTYVKDHIERDVDHAEIFKIGNPYTRAGIRFRVYHTNQIITFGDNIKEII